MRPPGRAMPGRTALRVFLAFKYVSACSRGSGAWAW